MSENRGVFMYMNEAELSASLERARKRAASLTTQMDKITDKASPEFLKLSKQLDQTTTKIGDMTKQLDGKLGPSLKQIESLVRKAWNELANIPVGTPEWKAKMAEFQKLNGEFIKIKQTVGSVGQTIRTFAQEVKTIATGVLIGNTVQAATEQISAYFSNFVSGAAKVSDEITDIQKTTGFTTEEVKKMQQAFSDLDTRSSSEQLRKLAYEAGKLGNESVEDVNRFVEEANMIQVALGQELGEDAINQIGKLAGIFDVSMQKIGSGINTVGASSQASEGYLTEFIFRLGGTAKQANVSAGDILGFGAALDIQGQNVEKSATALQNFLLDFVKDSEKFGKAAGMAEGELSGLVTKIGANDAFIAFLKNLKDTSATSDVFLKKLEALGIDGARGASTFLALANSIELVEQQQKIANEAIAEGTSIVDEYNLKNNNLAGTIEKISKEWNRLTSSREVQEWLDAAAKVTLNLVRALALLPKAIKDYAAPLTAVIALTVAYRANTLAAVASTYLATTATNAAGVASRLHAALLTAQTTAMLLMSTAGNVMAGRITLLTGLQRAWNLVTVSNPILALTTALIAAVSAIKAYSDNTAEALKLERDKNELDLLLTRTQRGLEQSYSDINKQVARFNSLSQEERENLRKTILMKIEQAKADMLIAEAKRKDVVAQEMQTTAWDRFVTAFLSGNNPVMGAMMQAERATERAAETNQKFNESNKALNAQIKDLKKTYEEVRPAMDLYNDAMAMQDFTIDDVTAKIGVLEKALGRAFGQKEIDLITKALNDARAKLKTFNLNLVEDEAVKKEAKKKGELYAKTMIDAMKEWQDNQDDPAAIYGLQMMGLNNTFDLAALKFKEQLATNVIDHEEYTGRIAALEIKRAEAKLALAKSSAEQVKAAAEDVGKFQIEWENKVYDETIRKNDAIANSSKETAEKVKANFLNITQEVLTAINGAGQLLTDIIGNSFALQQEQNANEFAAYKQMQDDKRTLLDRQLNVQLISQQEYDREVLKLELETRAREKKMKREQFVADKNSKMITAGINTALAVVNALATAPFPLAAIQAAFAAATGAVQIGFIARQPIPEFGDGGKLDGPSHDSPSRGLWVYDPEKKRVVSRLEGQEYVTNKTSTSKYGSLLEAINRDDTYGIAQWYSSQPKLNMDRYNQVAVTHSIVAPQFDDQNITHALEKSARVTAKSANYIVHGVVDGFAAVVNTQKRKL